jgi:hypothetical protein
MADRSIAISVDGCCSTAVMSAASVSADAVGQGIPRTTELPKKISEND